MTNFCQALAILRDSVIRTAISTRGVPAQGLTSRKSVIPARPAAADKHKVIGFMVVTPRGGVSRRGRRAEMKTTELSATGRLLGRARHHPCPSARSRQQWAFHLQPTASSSRQSAAGLVAGEPPTTAAQRWGQRSDRFENAPARAKPPGASRPPLTPHAGTDRSPI